MVRTLLIILIISVLLFGCINIKIPDIPFLKSLITPGPDIVNITSSDDILVQTDSKLLIKEALPGLEKAAKEIHDTTGQKVVITSAGRTKEKQAQLFYDNCIANGKIRCKPAVCDITNGTLLSKNADGSYSAKGELKDADLSDRSVVISLLAKNGKEENCQHTSNVAVDAWCERTDHSIANVLCQELLTQKMIENGFCRLDIEAWHFEWNAKKRSNGCRQDMGATYRVGSDIINPKINVETGNECKIWDYSQHYCVKEVKPETRTGISVTPSTITVKAPICFDKPCKVSAHITVSSSSPWHMVTTSGSATDRCFDTVAEFSRYWSVCPSSGGAGNTDIEISTMVFGESTPKDYEMPIRDRGSKWWIVPDGKDAYSNHEELNVDLELSYAK